MRLRLSALLMVAALLWSSLATLEGVFGGAGFADTLRATTVDAAGTPTPLDGSVEHHHLDDIPSQPQTDSVADLGALPRSLQAIGLGGLGAGPPPGPARAHLPSPPTGGPLRPPRPVHPGFVTA